MHGIIHTELKRFVVERFGKDAWVELLRLTNLSGQFFLVGSVYPDEQAYAIVGAASKLTGLSADELLESFGEFIVPSLVTLYGAFIKPDWKTEEMLLSTEETIHRVVRMKNPGALPPHLKFRREQPGVLRLMYDSPRKMGAVAKGIIRGVAGHFKETVRLDVISEADGVIDLRVFIS
jgi:hypothetical protein